MKATLFALFVALLMGGCGDGTVEWDDLERRGDVIYRKGERLPFTGYVRRSDFFKFEGNCLDGKEVGLWIYWHRNGAKQSEKNYKEGKKDGVTTWWYDDTQKESEFKYEEDRLMSAKVWKRDGQQCPLTNIVDGNGFYCEYLESGKNLTHYVRDGKKTLLLSDMYYLRELGF